MKNLKKVLMALVLVALLVSSVVTIAIADASYDGTVEEAQKKLEAVYEATAESDSLKAHADVKAPVLKELYEYLITVNPQNDGYAEIRDAYNSMTFKVMHNYFGEYEAATSDDARVAALTKVFDYKKGAPVIADINGSVADVYFAYGFVCKNCNESRDFANYEFFNGLATEGIKCPGKCTSDTQKLEYPDKTSEKAVTYVDFEKELNSAAIANVEVLVSYLFSVEEMSAAEKQKYASYYDYLEERKIVDDFVKEIKKKTYTPSASSPIYTGSVSDVAAKLAGVDKTSGFEKLKTALASAYGYLVKTPVDPSSDDFFTFFTKYNELCTALASALEAKVDACTSVDAKLAELADFRAYLAKNQIAESLVNKFNSLRDKTVSEYDDAEIIAGGLSAIEAVEFAPIYKDSLGVFESKLEAIEKALEKEEDITELVVTLYREYTSAFAYNPADEDFVQLTGRYFAICDAYVEDKFVTPLGDAKLVSEKLAILVEFNKFVSEFPLSENVVNAYNETRTALIEKLTALVDMLGDDKLPTYKAPAKQESAASKAVLDSFVESITASVDGYKKAEDKAIALEDMKKAMADIRAYMLGANFNGSETFFEEFVASYNAARDSVFDALMAFADASDANSVVANLETVRAFLAEVLLTNNSVNKYNAKVDALVTDADKAKALKLTNTYDEVYAVINAALASSDVAELRELGKKLLALDKTAFDITDSAYSVYVTDRDNAFAAIANAIAADIDTSLNASAASDDAALVAEYIKYASDVYVESIVEKTAEALKSIGTNFASVNKEITETNANAGRISTAYEAIASIVNEFDSATTLAARGAAFAKLFNALWKNTDYFNTVFIAGDSYSAIMLEYERIYDALEGELVALLSEDVSICALTVNLESVYDFIKEFSILNNAVELFNTAYEKISSANFGELLDKANADCPEFKYTTPADWNPNLSRINIAIEGSVDANGIVDKNFGVAYKILSGRIGVAGPQVIDFGVSGFYSTIEAFDSVKQRIVDKYAELILTSDVKAALKAFGKVVDKYPFSKKLVDGYNANYQLALNEYSSASNACCESLQALINEINERLKAFEINEKNLSAFDKEVYATMKSLIAAAEYCVVDKYVAGYTDVAENITGTHALIYKNLEYDKLNASLSSFAFGDASDALLVEANLKLAFIKFINMFDSEIAELSDDDKEDKIAALGSFMISRDFPTYLVDIYNAKYGKNYVASSVDAVNTPGAILDYKKVVEGVTDTDNSADARFAIVSMVEYVNSHKFSTEQKTLSTDSIKEQLEAETKAQIAALDKLVDATESTIKADVDSNFDTNTYKTSGDWGNAEGKLNSSEKIETVPGTTNKAMKLSNWKGISDFAVSIKNVTKGIVLDFDVMSPKTEELNTSMYFHGDKSTYTPFQFKNGVLSDAYGKTYTNFPKDGIKAVPGEWIHVTIAVNLEKKTQELYIDYVSLGTVDISEVPPERFQDGGTLALRIRVSNSTIYMDNFKIYKGTTYRTLGQTSEGVSDADTFKGYMGTLLDTGAKATDRLAAYYSAQSLKALVANECADLVAKLDEFAKTDLADVKAVAEAEHLQKVQELVATALASAKQSDIDAANKYIDANRLYIDQTSAEFRKCVQDLMDAADKITWLANIDKYISSTVNFNRATSYASLTRHLESITYYYELCELYDADRMAEAAKLAVAVAFTDKMQADASATALVPDVSFANYYSKYVPARLTSQLYYENSAKAVDCIAIIDALVENKEELTPDAYKAALLAAAGAEENFNFVDSYLTIVRKVLASGEYDEDYAGFEHVIEVYEILNPMFFNAIQQKHFEHIEQQLLNYTKTDSYIERAGICTYIRNYIEINNVDMNNDIGRGYLYSLEMYEEELVAYKIQYESVLAANTESFVGMVKKMQAYVTYSELKPLYDEVIAKYYYNMNVDSEEVQAAIEIFLEYEKKIKAWEENSAMLLVYAKDLKSTRMAQKFRALVRCSNFVGGADEGVSAEVAAAIKLYATAYSDYMKMIEPTIQESADATNIVNALRTNRISANVLAMANTVINK